MRAIGCGCSPSWQRDRPREGAARDRATSQDQHGIWGRPRTAAATTKATPGYRPTKAKQLLVWEAQVESEEGIRRLIVWAESYHVR